MSGDWRDEPELRDLDRDLRDRVGGELRAEAEESERLAAIAGRRSRDLADVAATLRDRGDRVAITAGGRTFLGTVAHVGSDLLQLRLGAAGGPVWASGPTRSRDDVATVDVNLAAPTVLRTVERARTGGVGPGPGPATFRARLRELEIAGAEVEVTAEALGDAVRARLLVVARDHVVLGASDAEEWFVPIAAIAAVTSRGGTVSGG